MVEQYLSEFHRSFYLYTSVLSLRHKSVEYTIHTPSFIIIKSMANGNPPCCFAIAKALSLQALKSGLVIYCLCI